MSLLEDKIPREPLTYSPSRVGRIAADDTISSIRMSARPRDVWRSDERHFVKRTRYVALICDLSRMCKTCRSCIIRRGRKSPICIQYGAMKENRWIVDRKDCIARGRIQRSCLDNRRDLHLTKAGNTTISSLTDWLLSR